MFSAGGHHEQFWDGQGCPLFDIVHLPFGLLTTDSLTLQGALKDGFGEAVMVHDMPIPCKFPSLDSCQKEFLWVHKEVEVALNLVIGLALKPACFLLVTKSRHCQWVHYAETWFECNDFI